MDHGNENLAQSYPGDRLPADIRSRFVASVNGLEMHVLEAGFDDPGRPPVLLLHGFPELAYSWRRVMTGLAAAGFHVIAPDQRGYGRTTGWDADYDGDLSQFRPLNLVRDALGLLHALELRSVTVVGHDFGSPVAAWCAMVRPDVFTRVALMSAPFAGPPPLADGEPAAESPVARLDAALAALPRPRKHYQRYYQTREANADLWQAPQGVHDFLRAYYHFKSADWPGNQPHPLSSASSDAMAELPAYYLMDLGRGMAETVADRMPTAAQVAANDWLPDPELAVYSEEFGRTGFQGGLNWYRAAGLSYTEQQLFAGRTLDQPALFISGQSDWGTYQNPGVFECMVGQVCTDLRGAHLVPGAGHWVQQEQAAEVIRLLLDFLRE